MTIISDILRDEKGNRYRIYPKPVEGETYDELVADSDLWEDVWSNPSYSVPTDQDKTYRTLVDGNGNTWYLYASTEDDANKEGTTVLDSTVPTAQTGIWGEPVYNEQTVDEGTTIHYLTLKDKDGNTFYLYPSVNGESILDSTQPS